MSTGADNVGYKKSFGDYSSYEGMEDFTYAVPIGGGVRSWEEEGEIKYSAEYPEVIDIRGFIGELYVRKK